MTFVDLIADASDVAEVVDLLNEFVGGLAHTGELEPVSQSVQPIRISTPDDISCTFGRVTDEIKRRGAVGEEIPDVLVALHAVLETAVERVKVSYH